MAARSLEEIRREIESERSELADAVGALRSEVASATDLGARLGGRRRVLVPAGFAAGFVLAGGVGATMRYLARRSREG